jgi:hypothetical protein
VLFPRLPLHLHLFRGTVMPFRRLRPPLVTYISLAVWSVKSLATTSICFLLVTIPLFSCKQVEKSHHRVWGMQVPLSVMFLLCGVGIPRIPGRQRSRMMDCTCSTWVRFPSKPSCAFVHSRSSSITRVDPRISSRTRPCRAIWSCCHNGWIQIHCIRRTGRRRILERCVEF